MSAFNNLDDAYAYAKDLLSTVANARGWADSDLYTDIASYIESDYTEVNDTIGITDELRRVNLLSIAGVIDSYENVQAQAAGTFWSNFTGYVSGTQFDYLDGIDKLRNALGSTAEAVESAQEEIEANQPSTIAEETVIDTAKDIKDTGKALADPNTYTGPIVLGAIILGIIVLLK